jgi:predicted aconitase with swiveling domain
MSPAAFTPPDTVVLPAELDISTTPRDVIGAALVIVDALEILTVAALIAPVPVVTVEDVPMLEMVTPCAAVIVGELVVL